MGAHLSRTTRRIIPVALIVMALLAGACSSGRGGDASPSPTTSGASSSTTGKFGTLDSPCGPGDAKGATDQGVTDTAIQIGYGDDAGYQPSPGLDHQVSDGMKAFIKWCNDQGGINGRTVEGTYYDAKVTEVTNVMTEACSKAFFLVGEYWVLDDGQETTRRGCGLPAVPAAAGTALFANAPLKWEPVPSAIDRASVYAGRQLQQMYPDETKKTGILWGDYAVIRDRKDQINEAFTGIGWEFLPDCSVSYSISGESDWKPFVQKLKDCGAEAVYWVGSPYPNFENVLDAAAQIDYHPIWYTDPNTYDESFRQWNTSGNADRVYMRQTFLPLEEADSAPAVQQFLDLVDATGGDPNQQGMQAASAFLLWATATKACGSNVTRACVGEELSKIHEWTGGGLHAPADPGNNEPSQCGMLLGMKGTTFVRLSPTEQGTFSCDPANVFALSLTSDVLVRHNIGADRIAPLP